MGKYLNSLREKRLELNQSENVVCDFHTSEQDAKRKKLDIPNLTECQKCQKASVHAQAQPDARELAREVTAARRGQWLTPTPALLALWRAFEAHFGHRITSQQIGGIGAMVDANSQINNDEAMVAIGAFLRQGESR